MQNNKLIFDLGFCDGADTEYYLSKGYEVVAVEGNPNLTEIGNKKFKDEINKGQLILLNNVVSDEITKIDFYIHPTKLEWGSIYQHIAEQDGETSTKIIVESINISSLFEKYGIPYYMKVDIEGCDIITSFHLRFAKEKPKFVSFELNKIDYMHLFINLQKAGYKYFQLRNQANNTPLSSGLFGQLLPLDKWVSADIALDRYIKFNELRGLDRENLSFGWLDIHAQQ